MKLQKLLASRAGSSKPTKDGTARRLRNPPLYMNRLLPWSLLGEQFLLFSRKKNFSWYNHMFLLFDTRKYCVFQTFLLRSHHHHHQPWSAHCRAKASPSWCQGCLSCAVAIHLIPIDFVSSSLNLSFCLPICLEPNHGLHSVTRLVHLLSDVHARWPAHFHFFLRIDCIMSATLVWFLIHSSVFLSHLDIPSMVRSILCWVVFSFCSIFIVTAQVSEPYIIAGCTHWLKTFLLRQIGLLLLMISLKFPNALQPALVLLLTSSNSSWSILICCPRYTYSGLLYQFQCFLT